MKKNKLVLAIIATAGLFFSCDDAINIKQPGEENDPDVVYSNLDDLQKGLISVYGSISPESTIEFTSIFTDEVALGITNGGQGLNDGTYTFQLTAGSDAAASIWVSNYATINFANRILDAGAKIAPTTDINDPDYNESDVIDYNNIVAQLLVIRAYAHLQLETYFSTDMKNNDALGVMILDFVPDDSYSQYLARSTNKEVFDFITKDLDEAESKLSIDPDGTIVNSYMLTALRARMAAYRGQYAEALAYTNSLIEADAFPIITVGTATSQDEYDAAVEAYNDMWGDTNRQELLFYLRRVPGDFEIGSYWNSQSSARGGSPFFEVGRALYNAYEEGDIRRDALVDASSDVAEDYATTSTYKESDVLVVNRYPGDISVRNSYLINDIKVIRITEIMLLRAEALAGLGQLNGNSNSVADALRDIRFARSADNSVPSFASATDAWAAILAERRKELAFEGFRYTDIHRLGVLAGGKGTERYVRDCDLYNACTMDPTDHRFTMPIPTTELVANPAIRGQQNPGY
jgi:hypothetical protein